MLRRARAFVVVLVAGCYRYMPAPEPSVVAGAYVRLALMPVPALQAVLGQQAIAVEGQVTRVSDSAYTMKVAATLKPGTTSPAPSRTVWAGEPVTVPRSAVTGMELRSLDRGKTTRVIVIAAVAAVVIVKVIVSTVGGSSGGDDGGGVIIPP